MELKLHDDDRDDDRKNDRNNREHQPFHSLYTCAHARAHSSSRLQEHRILEQSTQQISQERHQDALYVVNSIAYKNTRSRC